MPRANKKVKLPDPVDIIDLTQESSSFRISRSRSETTNCDIIPVPIENDIENDHNHRQCNRKRLRSQPTAIINLEETISLEDSPSKPTKSPYRVLTESPKTKALSCPICLESLADGKLKAMTTPCGHVFCFDCLKKITESKKKCSICQRAITFSKCIRLHI